MIYTSTLLRFPAYAIAILLITFSSGCKMQNKTADTLPRDQSLPLFEPHMPSFECKVEAASVPVVDAEADAWFRQARVLESPEIFQAQRDYKKIVELTRQAAERRHWKAMLNLASLYIENRDPAHGVEDAVIIVEQAMRLGIPAAYDRMGTYHMNGTGVPGDISRAYAFFQKAAQMGNPQAMTFLAEKLSAGSDDIMPGYWDNIPISIKMLECALGQGYGPAAEYLSDFYASPRSADGTIVGDDTAETKDRALRVLHKGVMLGCAQCAGNLAAEFHGLFGPTKMLAPHIDEARTARYHVLNNELSFNPSARFHNLDKILPLPPADLPPWNGDKETLIAAAMGVTLPLTAAKTMMVSTAPNSAPLDPQYTLRRSGAQVMGPIAPLAGYWQPDTIHWIEAACRVLANTEPQAYGIGEPFAQLCTQTGDTRTPISSVLWRHATW